MTHPCQDKCPNFDNEQCCHCLIRHDEPAKPNADEQKFIERALESLGEVA